MVKIVVLAPMPIASDAAAVRVKTGLRRSRRAAYRRSCSQESSMIGITRRRANGSQAAELFQPLDFEGRHARHRHAPQVLLELGLLGAAARVEIDHGGWSLSCVQDG